MKTVAHSIQDYLHNSGMDHDHPAAFGGSGFSGLHRLATAVVVAATALVAPVFGQSQLSPAITNVARVNTLINDSNILFNRTTSSSAAIAYRSGSVWNTTTMPSGASFCTTYDQPRQRFVGPQWGSKGLSILQLNSAGSWYYVRFEVNDYTYGDTVAVDPATGDIFFRALLGGPLYVCNVQTGNRGTVISTVPGGVPILDSRDPERSIYFQGADYHPYRTYFSGGQWRTQMLSSDLLRGDPRVNNTKSIIYRDSQNRIASTWWTGSMWLSSPWNSVTNVLCQPVVGNSGEVFYCGTDKNLYKCYWSGSGFSTAQLTNNANISVANSAFGNLFVNSQNRVIYVGTDQTLWIY